MLRRRLLYLGAGALVAGGGVLALRRGGGPSPAASPVTLDEIGDQVQTVARGGLPEFAGPGTPGIRALYRYAVEHGDELRWIPCYCGCGSFGHRSNRDCYVKGEHPDGSLTFTSHAAT